MTTRISADRRCVHFSHFWMAALQETGICTVFTMLKVNLRPRRRSPIARLAGNRPKVLEYEAPVNPKMAEPHRCEKCGCKAVY